MQCIVVTPECTVRDEPADFVAVTLFDGEIGIASGHAPLLGRLGYGEMRIKKGDQTDRYYVEGGFVEALNDVVTVLAGRVVPAEKLDSAVAREQLSASLDKPSKTPELAAIKERAVAISRAQVRVAEKSGR